MELILWRHAEAEDGVVDLKRNLTEKGIEQAKLMSKWLKKHHADKYEVWVSEAKRTQQTASFLSKKAHIYSELNPNSSADKILKLLYQTHWKKNLIIVGHQPWLGQLAAQLLNQQPSKVSWSVKKGSVWWFEVKLHDVPPPYARLRVMMPVQKL